MAVWGNIFRQLWLGFNYCFKAIFADRAALSIMIGAVVLYSFFYPLAYQQQVAKQQAITIVDLDNSSLSRELSRNIMSLQAVKVTNIVNQEHYAIAALEQMQIQAYVVIDAHFEADIYSAKPANIALFANAAWLSRSSGILNGIADAITHFAQQAALKQASFSAVAAKPALEVVARPLYNTREGYASSVVTGVAELIVQQTLLIGLALLAGTRRELYGRLRFNGATFVGVALAASSLAMLNLLYYWGFMFWYQDYPQHGRLLNLLLASWLYAVAIAALGLLLASLFRTRERALQLIIVTSLPVFFLSNLSWPVETSPKFLVLLAQTIPSTVGINLLVKISQMGASLGEVKTELFTLLGHSVLYGSLAYWRYCLQPKCK